MQEIKIYNHPQFGEIRTAGTSENPLFCLKDVCEVLGLRVDNVTKRIGDPYPIGVLDSNGHRQQTYFINEKNLYRVIMRSDKQVAVDFQNWVCDEVLPSIRKHGMYATGETLDRLITSPEFGIRLLSELKDEREARMRESALREQAVQAHQEEHDARMRLTAEHHELVREMGRVAPLADYCKQVLTTNETVTVSQIAQDYGYTAQAFNNLLHDLGLQYFVNGQWILYASIKDKGYVQSFTALYTRHDGTQVSKMYTRWTQCGRLFLYHRLKSVGIVPVMELIE